MAFSLVAVSLGSKNPGNMEWESLIWRGVH